MVNLSKTAFKNRSALTLVEVLVTSMLLAVVMTGMLAMMSLTMGRMALSSASENEEKQMDRAQVELHYFISRASSVKILDGGGDPAVSGDTLVCTLQPNSLSQTPITSVKFSLVQNGSDPTSTFTVTVTQSTGVTQTYTYSQLLITQPTPMFSLTSNGFIKFSWALDGGYGTENFVNMAAPRTSL